MQDNQNTLAEENIADSTTSDSCVLTEQEAKSMIDNYSMTISIPTN